MKIISIVKDGRRIDLTKAQFIDLLNKEYQEEQHPRDPSGKWTSGGGKEKEPTKEEKDKYWKDKGYVKEGGKYKTQEKEVTPVPYGSKEHIAGYESGERKDVVPEEPAKYKGQKEMGGESEYEFTHGKRPSGDGSWAFRDADGKTHFINGKYSDAKRQALRTLKQPKVLT